MGTANFNTCHQNFHRCGQRFFRRQHRIETGRIHFGSRLAAQELRKKGSVVMEREKMR
jgi:hypothetical protein